MSDRIGPHLQNTWESFLRIERPAVADVPPEIDETWLASKGIWPDAPTVLRHVRNDVLPLIRRLEMADVIEWHSFLIHDVGSGVPTTPDDKALYIHLRLSLSPMANGTDLKMVLPAPWVMTRQAPLSREIAGFDAATMDNGDLDPMWWLIGEQSALMLKFVEHHLPSTDDLTLLKHVRQFLHFFANMAQMRIA